MMQSRLLARLLRPFTLYLGHNNQAAQPELMPKYKLTLAVILGREHYQERHNRYPVTDAAALKKVLAHQTPPNQVAIHLISEVQNRQRQVQSFIFEKKWLKRYPTALFWLPESLVLGQQLSEGQMTEVNAANISYFVACSRQQWVSAVKTPQLPTAALFAHAFGQPYLEVQPPVLPASHACCLQANLAKVTAAIWRSCFILPGVNLKQWQWKPYAIATAAVFASYQIILSGYILWQQQYWQSKTVNPELNLLLTQTEQTQQLALQVNEQLAIQAERNNPAVIWPVLAQLTAQGAELQGIVITNNDVTLRGSALQATSLLEWLRSQSIISGVRLDAPLRTQSGREVFVIKFTLNPAAQHTNAQSSEEHHAT